MPKGIYYDLSCTFKHKDIFNPLPHQLEAKTTFLASKYKGLLLYHKLGSGKTCTAILIADEMLAQNKVEKVVIFTPGSLRQTWVQEYCKKCGFSRDTFRKFIFITYNYNVDQLPNLNNSLVIIDEVHNLINGVRNKSKIPTKIYSAITSSNCRVIALSGTPIFNYVEEFPLLGKLINPNENNFNVSGEEFLTANFNISDEGILTPKNPIFFNKMLNGIISYYPGQKGMNPDIIFEEPFLCEMSLEQEQNYWRADYVQSMFDYPPSPSLAYRDPKKYEDLKRLYIMARKRILTREASNMYYPEEYKSKSDFIADLSQNGWISKSALENKKLLVYSRKLTTMLLNITLFLDQKHVVFTFFKERAGANLIYNLLKLAGITSAVFSGDSTDAERTHILNVYNHPNNRNGDLLKVLIITEAGSEGISILEARHIHILESGPRVNRILQAVGRVARFKSHINLPEKDRNVRVWKYWSVAGSLPVKIKTTYTNPEGESVSVEKMITEKPETVDIELDREGQIVINKNDSFLQLLQSSSATKF